MSGLFVAERIESFSFSVGTQSKTICPESELRYFIDIVLISGSPIWICRSHTAGYNKGVFMTGVGSSYSIDNWFGAISCLSEGSTVISGEIGYAE